jgi:hypothetical protein
MCLNTCEFKVGRLLELRAGAGYTSVRDVQRMIAMMRAQFSALPPGGRCVIAADWRSVRMMSPETAQRAREMLAGSNPRVIRSAILTLPDRSLANLQVVRLVREAESENRKHFTSAEDQKSWLAEVLSEPEQARLAQFLELGTAAPDRAPQPRLAATPSRNPGR